MYFRLGSKEGDYYDLDAVIPDDVIAKVPDDIQLVYWDYYHHREDFYTSMIKKHKRFPCGMMFAGGIWTWNGISIHYDKTFITTNAALEACKKEGIDEVIATIWGDNGAETNIFAGLLGMQLYAEHGYSNHLDVKTLKKRFKICTGGDYNAFMSLSKLDTIPTDNLEDCASPSNPSKFLLWQDILIGLFDKHVGGKQLNNYYLEVAKILKEYVEEAGKFKYIFEMPYKLALVLSYKSEIGLQIKKHYDSKNHDKLEQYAQIYLPRLEEKVRELREEHREQWLKVYKPFGWEVIDIRYGGLLARIDTARYRIIRYLRGEIERIDELEQERMLFDNYNCLKYDNIGNCNKYHRIVSAGALGMNG